MNLNAIFNFMSLKNEERKVFAVKRTFRAK